MKPHFRLRHAALLAALAAAFPAVAFGAGAARVEFASGNVTAQAPGSSARTLAKGAEIFPGETVLTNEGIAQMRFTDGARVSLKSGTEFRIDEYRYNGKPDGEEKGFFSLLKGGLRTITGLVGRSDRAKYQMRTATATIGIRGTEYSVAYGNSINVNTGEGVVEVCNTAGCLLLYPGDEGYVATPTSPPALIQAGAERPSKDSTPPGPSTIEAPGNDRDGNGGIEVVGGGGSTITGSRNYTVVLGRVSAISVPVPVASAFETSPGDINANGALSSFQSGTGLWNPGADGSTTSLGNDGVVAWGRWTAGSSGFVIASSPEGVAGDLLHYVVGLPTSASDPALPTNVTATYSLLGGSASAYTGPGSGTTGSVTSGSMQVTFGSSFAQVDNFTLSINAGNAYTLNSISPMSITTSVGGNLQFAGSGTASGCVSGCSTATVSGAFFGSGASRAGLGFGFSDSLAGSQVTGAAAFSRTSTAPIILN
jgi:hypothetical protein